MDRTCQFAAALPVTPLPSVVRVRGICQCMCRFRICGSGGFCPPSGWQTGMLCADAVGVPAVRHVSVVPAGHFPPAPSIALLLGKCLLKSVYSGFCPVCCRLGMLRTILQMPLAEAFRLLRSAFSQMRYCPCRGPRFLRFRTYLISLCPP